MSNNNSELIPLSNTCPQEYLGASEKQETMRGTESKTGWLRTRTNSNFVTSPHAKQWQCCTEEELLLLLVGC